MLILAKRVCSANKWRGVACASLWSLAINSFVFRDSAPKARYQNSLGHRIISKRPTVGFKRVRMRGVSEEDIRVRYVTNEQRSRRTLFKPTHWAVAS